MTITVFEDILTGNLGDGWDDLRTAADAYATVLTDALRATVLAAYPAATVVVDLRVRECSGTGRALGIDSELPGEEEYHLIERLRDVETATWEEFCVSGGVFPV
jgi:hypothetical protein